MNEEQRAASSSIAAALSGLRAGSGALRAADVALAVRPSHASNARWFMRMFVIRRQATAVRAGELFWKNLDIARDQHAECDLALIDLFEQYSGLGAVMQLHEELGAAGYDGIRDSLHENVVAGEEAQASARLQSVVARMRLCETRMLAAIRAIAAAE